MHHQTSLDYLVNSIGEPYSKLDCYDIVKGFYSSVLDIDLDNLEYAQPIERSEINEIFNLQKFNFKRVNDRRFGDIIVFRVIGLAAHIGVYLEGKKFLHTTKKTDCVIDSLDRYEKRIVGFYRWPSLDTV